MAKPKHKSMRNQPELYDEIKKPVTFSLTETAVKQLDLLAKIQGISRSEVVEQFTRGRLNFATQSPPQTNH
jgi:hypothetical protein